MATMLLRPTYRKSARSLTMANVPRSCRSRGHWAILGTMLGVEVIIRECPTKWEAENVLDKLDGIGWTGLRVEWIP